MKLNADMYNFYKSSIIGLIKDNYNYSENKICPCLDLYGIINLNFTGKYKVEYMNHKLAWALQGKVKPAECFDYYLNKQTFYVNNSNVLGVNSLSILFFEKDISKLNHSELTNFINYLKYGRSNILNPINE